MEVGTRKLLHLNATLHPTSSWTFQQLREAIPSDHAYRWLVHTIARAFFRKTWIAPSKHWELKF
jgi:hypothetical protein